MPPNYLIRKRLRLNPSRITEAGRIHHSNITHSYLAPTTPAQNGSRVLRVTSRGTPRKSRGAHTDLDAGDAKPAGLEDDADAAGEDAMAALERQARAPAGFVAASR